MAKDLAVMLENHPGTLAAMGETLGKAGINIEGGSGSIFEGKGAVHILVEDAAAARRTLEAVGIQVGVERDVLVVDVQDRPGELGRTSRRLADAGVNIDLFYLTTKSRVVLGVDNMEKARRAMG